MVKIEEWLEDDKLILLEAWARDGLTNEQIANNIGINVKTLYDWKNKHSNISNALKKGKEVVDFEVENALYKSAIGGNVTAQIFWLKNRKPDVWREKQELNIKSDPIEDLTPLAELLKGEKK